MSANRAAKAVRGWLRENPAPLETPIGRQVARLDTYADGSGAPLYYIAVLEPEGFVILAADDRIEPVIGFAPAGVYDPSPDNPLSALVNGDIPGRLEAVKKAAAGRLEREHREGVSRKWVHLDAAEDAIDVETGIGTISDVRVSPLTATLWNQTTAAGNACYNYYVPPNAEGTAGNYPCGCVATAMAQLMRFWKHPVNAVGSVTFTIYTDGVASSRSLRGGNGAGGAYVWNDMVLAPSSSTLDQRKAIGALCHDAGVAVNMEYAAAGSAADTMQAKTAFVNTFGYARAVKGYNNGANIGAGLNGMINPNLDAGFPVLLGITGAGGHAVVADGYGYNSATLYHHVNLGWGGSYTAWYNLPTIDAGGYNFNSVYKCVYNVWPSGSGEIISGRVTTQAGVVLSNVVLTAVRSAGGTYSATTDVRGIYAFAKVPSSSTYTLSATRSGYTFTNGTVSTGSSADYGATAGNRWGVNFTTPDPSVMVTLSLAGSPMTEAGGTATLTATLSTTLPQTVTVLLAFSGTATRSNDYTASAASIAIPSGSTNGTVTLTAIQDARDEANETVIVDISSVSNAVESGTQQVTATITDDDTAGVTKVLSGGTTLVSESGGTDTYTVVLRSMPSANVTITLSPGLQVWVSPASLVFTSGNWADTQTVTVGAVDDGVVEASHTGLITHAASSSDPGYNGLSISPVVAIVTDNDTTLQVVSPFGVSDPPVGTTVFTIGKVVTNQVTGFLELNNTQYVCRGASVRGNAYMQQAPNRVVMTLTNPAVLTWDWSTNVLFACEPAANCVMGGSSNGWYEMGASVTVTSTPALYNHFAPWSGDMDAAQTTLNPLVLVMSRSRWIQAHVAPDVVTNGTPTWWLASYGLPTNNAGAAYDDGDGVPAWAEFVAGTDPTNPASVFEIGGFGGGAVGSGHVLSWEGVTGRVYAIWCATNLADGFVPVATGLHAGTGFNAWTDAVPLGVRQRFYKVTVTNEP